MGYQVPRFFIFPLGVTLHKGILFRNVFHLQIFNNALPISPFIFSSTISGNPSDDAKTLRFHLGKLEFSG